MWKTSYFWLKYKYIKIHKFKCGQLLTKVTIQQKLEILLPCVFRRNDSKDLQLGEKVALDLAELDVRHNVWSLAEMLVLKRF